MDRSDPDIVGLQTTFIRTVVKPCFEALSVSNYIIDKNSIVRKQLDENLKIWENTKIDENGEMIIPELTNIKTQRNEIENRITETDTLIGKNKI